MSKVYSQKELLLLSNFVYIPACLSDKPIEEIIDAYRDEDGHFSESSVYPAAAGGGMSVKDVCTVFSEIDKHIEDNPGFGRLSASRCLNEADVRAICYTNDDDESPVVAFRGTGGTSAAWTDNFDGAYLEDTRIQKVADDFVRYECGIYEDIVVTGHSKGGNLAQYVTVKRGNMIDSCVSFDGQGFGDDFISDDADGIAKAAPKITSISAYNDFVNILLTCIAGECIYVANEASAEAAHSSVTLLTSNEFDEEGCFITTRPQGIVSRELSGLTHIMTQALDPLSQSDKETMGMIAGTAISLALTTPTEEYAEGVFAPVLGTVAAKFAAMIAVFLAPDHTGEAVTARSVYIDTSSAHIAAENIADLSGDIARISANVDEVRQNMAFTINTQIFAESTLAGVIEELETIRKRLITLSECIRNVAVCYEKAENDAVWLMNA